MRGNVEFARALFDSEMRIEEGEAVLEIGVIADSLGLITAGAVELVCGPDLEEAAKDGVSESDLVSQGLREAMDALLKGERAPRVEGFEPC